MLVGLTGGIGSGKSTVALIFSALKIPVFDADTEAKKLYKLPNVKKEVIKNFGHDIYSEDVLQKDKLARIVFNSPQKLKSLEFILYPALQKNFETWQLQFSHAPYLIKEAAVMIEKGSYEKMDKIILVTADKELRIERVQKRNSISREEVEARIKEQWSDMQKREYSDFEIANNQEISLLKQVWKIHQKLIQLANEDVDIK